MKNASTETGEAELFFLLVIFIAIACFMTFVLTQDVNRADCRDFGKTRIFGKLYECKPVES